MVANKKLILTRILFYTRIVILISLIFSLIFYDKYLFLTFFVLAGCLELCDNILSIKESLGGSVFVVLSNIVGRLVFLLPLLFLALSQAIALWVFFILVFFEIVIVFYKKLTTIHGKAKVYSNILYFLYVIFLWLSIFIWFFNDEMAMYLIVVCSVFAGIYIIYCSIFVGKEDESIEELPAPSKDDDIDSEFGEDDSQLIE